MSANPEGSAKVVQSDKGRELFIVIFFVHSFSKNTLTDPGEGLIVRPAYPSGPPLSIRWGPAHRLARRTTFRRRAPSQRIRSRAMRVFPARENLVRLHGKNFFGRRVIHRSCGERFRGGLLASMNNSGIAISQGVALTGPAPPLDPAHKFHAPR
jgi:hypothetical protein